MVTCPQCDATIEGIDHKSYGVGWCQRDIHRSCLPTHVRTCRDCRAHNEEYLSHQKPVKPKLGRI